MTEIIHATTISSLKKDQSKAGKARSMDKVKESFQTSIVSTSVCSLFDPLQILT